MTIQGLNNLLTVIRPTEGVLDAVGGATISEAVVYSQVMCRVSNPTPATRNEQIEGLDYSKAIQIVVYPANYAIKGSDIVIPSLGSHANQRFIVVQVKRDSLPPTHPNAHIELTCERVDEARKKQ
jgi:hypothetical protein